ncbi:hypothetical protein PN441_18170 [Spirulina major CS-329]|uniref:hypothetical protein n=1 Tax=Spirulina TaxID=1154 RepID=UPI00232BB6E4|nr:MULTISPECIES: hypothetical protein [Spirulina]MDB9493060.1 hypothetical protein [Spirulina subsalsa CS-330]MDB9505008.1 hypothetical protein [Spirulina major CS-329]
MVTSTETLKREQLLKLAEEYRNQGYEVSLHQNLEDLPDFLQNYRPDMIARRGDESVVIAVQSRRSLGFASRQYLQNLAQSVEQHSGWRFEFVMTNPEDDVYISNVEHPLQQDEIATKLPITRQLVTQHLESAILYAWSLFEATLRLVTEHEGLSLQRLDSLYLVKQLVTEGVISRSEYQLLMNTRSLRNVVAHGFKTTQLTQESVSELIDLTEQLLNALHSSTAAD